jgi:diguanylate cyclase (GGDEF)-like protein
MGELHRKIISKPRREYNQLVASEMMEDYALRYVPDSFRKWSEFLVANTAIGGISFLALEAIGASIAVSYGFTNAFWAILVVGFIIFLTNLPIAYYSAKYNLDIDLLTRGAGFGYIGSTITSLIYATFTFIFFALEAAIMAQALELYFNLPLSIGYILCSLIIIPLVFFGITLINRLQIWTQPLWLILMVAPFAFVYHKVPETFSELQFFAGQSPSGAAFDPLLFGAAATVSFALIVQIGEQVDYLRFLPDKGKHNRRRWWAALLIAGPGWIVLGVVKQLGGMFLAFLAITQGLAIVDAVEPTQMYMTGFGYVFSSPAVVLAITVLFVVVSQIKINVTNAYAGSLAWSNFFSRLTHRHPGRVVWLVFNIIIALLLMQLGVFAALEKVLGLYANVAVAWIGALFADLAINKPLGLSPSYIEFKRGHLHNINPVGTGSMLIASVVSIVAFMGVLGPIPQAFSPFIALGLAIVLVPMIALLTRGKYYIARQSNDVSGKCIICEQSYVAEDSLFCPVYGGTICSLCCTLDSRCGDACKKTNESDSLITQWMGAKMQTNIFRFLSIFLFVASLIGAIFGMVFYQQSITEFLTPEALDDLKNMFLIIYAAILIFLGMGVWWFVLTERSHQLAQDEVDAQNNQLQNEIAERLKVEQRLARDKCILEMVASGDEPFSVVLDTIVREIEAEDPNWLCSILLLSADGQHLMTGAAPNLPESYNTAIDGMAIGAGIGSCGNTAFTGKRTIVENIQTHAYWVTFKELAAKADLMSCWSEPIRSAQGKMLGTFAIYHHNPEVPTQDQFNIIASFAHLAGIAIELKLAEENKQLTNKLIWQQANYDALTGLPNRSMFQDRLQQEIKKSHRTKHKMALMFIDLDRFKEVNDSLGHNMGDRLLIEVARRICNCVRESDTVARLGGDEFTVILPALNETSQVERTAQTIIDNLADPFKFDEVTASISASIGITMFPDDASTPELLMINADHAMYTAKHSGRNRFSYFTVALQEASQNRLQLIRDLRGALAAKQFTLNYQPIVELANGSIHKAEALLRWYHPVRGWVSPAEFIPLAEESGLINAIGDWVFKQAVQEVKHLRETLDPEFQISINKSPIQFRSDSNLFKEWLPYLKQLDLPGECLIIEITEGALLDMGEIVTNKLLTLRDVGIQVAIDDFGTGYSALSYLNKFDIDYLKIDRSFVCNLTDHSDDMALCEAIITMAHKLGLKVIAEGVETIGQCELLVAAGCDYGQGFFFSRPVTAEVLEVNCTFPQLSKS